MTNDRMRDAERQGSAWAGGPVRRARGWWQESSYLEDVALVFTAITVVSSGMMVTGWDTPKTGTFAYTHLLSRLAIVASVVALFHLDGFREQIERWRHGDSRRWLGTIDRGRGRNVVEPRIRRIAQAPLEWAAAAFTAVTGVLCLVALASSVWQEPRGGVAVYQALLALAATLAILVGCWTWWHRSRQAPPRPFPEK